MAEMDGGLMVKIARLRTLLVHPKIAVVVSDELGSRTTYTTSLPIATEIADLRRDILGSGISEDELAERVAPGVSGF
jgi:hypothetical protein